MSDAPEKAVRGQPLLGGASGYTVKVGPEAANPCIKRDLEEPCPPWYIRYKWVFIILGVAIVLNYGRWLYLRARWGADNIIYKDPMNVKVVDIPWLENCCSWWPISHFVLFFILGYVYPELWWVMIILGVLWELLESVMATLTHRERQAVKTENQKIEYSGDWWAGSFKDVLMDAAGVLAGAAARLLMDHLLGESRDKCGRVVLKKDHVEGFTPGGASLDHSLSFAL